MWDIYILECSDKTLYIGITTDLKRRVREHNEGKTGAKYTAGRRPVKLVYTCRRKNQSRALKEEYRLKSLSRAEKLALIKAYENKKFKRNSGKK